MESFEKLASEYTQYCEDCGTNVDVPIREDEDKRSKFSLCWMPESVLCDKCELRRFRNETKKHVSKSKQKELYKRRG